MSKEAKKRPPRNQPYSYEEQERILPLIFERIAVHSEPVGKALKHVGEPSLDTFYKWLKGEHNRDRAEIYAQACEKRAENIFEEIIEIADDSSGDVEIDDKGRKKLDKEFAARARIRIDARKWMLGKMQPKKYGDRLALDHDGKIEIEQIKGMQIE